MRPHSPRLRSEPSCIRSTGAAVECADENFGCSHFHNSLQNQTTPIHPSRHSAFAGDRSVGLRLLTRQRQSSGGRHRRNVLYLEDGRERLRDVAGAERPRESARCCGGTGWRRRLRRIELRARAFPSCERWIFDLRQLYRYEQLDRRRLPVNERTARRCPIAECEQHPSGDLTRRSIRLRRCMG